MTHSRPQPTVVLAQDGSGHQLGAGCAGSARPGASRAGARRACCGPRSSTSTAGQPSPWRMASCSTTASFDHLARIAGLGDPPLQVLGVLGPPEQLRHGQADLLDDLAGHEEPAPRRPDPERAVAPAGTPGRRTPTPGPGRPRPTAARGSAGSGRMSSSSTQAWVARREELAEGLGVAAGRPGVDVRAHQYGGRGRPMLGSDRPSPAAGWRCRPPGPPRAATVWAAMASRHRSRLTGALWVSTTAMIRRCRLLTPPRPPVTGRLRASTNQPVSSRAASTTSPASANHGASSVQT